MWQGHRRRKVGKEERRKGTEGKEQREERVKRIGERESQEEIYLRDSGQDKFL